MPEFFRSYAPPKLSNIRERAARAALDRRRVAEKNLSSLQDYAASGLSPLELELQRQREAYYKTVIDRSEDLIKEIRRQRQVAAVEQEDLRPSRLRLGLELHRSTEDRNRAILGLLQRERRQNAPLSREALARAQAIAASRRRYDLGASQLRGSRGYAYMVQQHELLDPCVEYEARQKVRRQVMFAQQSNIGHRTRKTRSPC